MMPLFSITSWNLFIILVLRITRRIDGIILKIFICYLWNNKEDSPCKKFCQNHVDDPRKLVYQMCLVNHICILQALCSWIIPNFIIIFVLVTITNITKVTQVNQTENV